MYLLKFSACLLVFWLVYVVFLERQKMHHFKRFYLLTAFAMALTIPLLSITEYVEPVPVINFTDYYVASETTVDVPTELPKTTTSYLPILLWSIYGLGVTLFLVRFVVNLVTLYRKILNNETLTKGHFIYVLLNSYRIPHSFFKYIFLNKASYETNTIPKEVLLHEETHAKQLHSIDILIVELLQIVFWFHPLIYILKHHIKLNHEFLADQAVLNHGADTKNYQTIVLQFSYGTPQSQLVSAFNYSSIKKRLTVMNTQTSKIRVWLSSLLLLPIIGLLFYSFAERNYVEKDNQDLVTSIKNEIETANDFKTTYIENDGATPAMIKEYNDWIIAFNTKHIVDYTSYHRIVAIYELMTPEQRQSVERYPVIPSMNLTDVNPKSPTKTEFESWKNAKQFAIWINGKHVPNSTLNNYTEKDIIHFVGSKVHSNARSEKFPQPYQYSLYTKAGFKTKYQESDINTYRRLSKTYSEAIKSYLKGPQTDNSELLILGKQVENMYKSFSKEDMAKHKLLPPPPVPAKYKTPRHKKNASKSNKASKGGPNTNYVLKQQKATKAQITEYNAWANKIHTESKKLSGDTTFYPPINEDELIKFSEIYKRMSPQQKNQSVAYPFPSLELEASKQQKATKAQVAEYNTWAKKLNAAIKKTKADTSYEYPIIKQKEAERYLHIYKNVMTEGQRKTAEPFPNIPPPPKAKKG